MNIINEDLNNSRKEYINKKFEHDIKILNNFKNSNIGKKFIEYLNYSLNLNIECLIDEDSKFNEYEYCTYRGSIFALRILLDLFNNPEELLERLEE